MQRLRSWPRDLAQRMIDPMNRITAIMEADADGTIHLPLPEGLRHGKVEVTATLRAVGTPPGSPPPPAPAAPDRVARRRIALRELRELGGLQSLIPDPAAWQRELRQDRKLPGRE